MACLVEGTARSAASDVNWCTAVTGPDPSSGGKVPAPMMTAAVVTATAPIPDHRTRITPVRQTATTGAEARNTNS